LRRAVPQLGLSAAASLSVPPRRCPADVFKSEKLGEFPHGLHVTGGTSPPLVERPLSPRSGLTTHPCVLALVQALRNWPRRPLCL